jgi:hypothetical protein
VIPVILLAASLVRLRNRKVTRLHRDSHRKAVIKIVPLNNLHPVQRVEAVVLTTWTWTMTSPSLTQ